MKLEIIIMFTFHFNIIRLVEKVIARNPKGDVAVKVRLDNL